MSSAALGEQQTSSAPMEEVRIGVLAIQGDFAEHVSMMKSVGDARRSAGVGAAAITVEEVRQPAQLEQLDGLIIPGGESTTLSVFLRRGGFEEKLRWFMGNDGGTKRYGCVWGTCAGLILLSAQLDSQKQGGQVTLGGIDIQSTRNAYGRQINSFEANLKLKEPKLFEKISDSTNSTTNTLAHDEYPGVFIRAPGIVKVNSPSVTPLATLQTKEEESVVGVQQAFLMATTFHPELTTDTRWHRYFLDMIISCKSQNFTA